MGVVVSETKAEVARGEGLSLWVMEDFLLGLEPADGRRERVGKGLEGEGRGGKRELEG